MKRFSIILISLLLAAVVFPSKISAQDYPYAGGEQLVYKLNYKWGVISADVANLNFSLREETFNGQPCFRLVTKGATSNLVGALVKVDYFYDSRFSVDDLTPLAFSREQTEGSYWARNSYTWENGGRRLKAHVEKSTRPVRDTVFTSPVTINDVIACFYVIRASDLDAVKAGKKLHLVSAIDCNVNDVYVSYVKSEDKKVSNIGTVATDKYMMKVVERKGAEKLDKESSVAVSHDGDGLAPIYLWLTQDETKTIVSFSATVPVGGLHGRLVEAKGLKSPLKTIDK